MLCKTALVLQPLFVRRIVQFGGCINNRFYNL